MGLKPFRDPQFRIVVSQANERAREKDFTRALKLYASSAKRLYESATNPTFDENFWPMNTYLVNDEYRFLYCPIPKVACTALKEVLVELSTNKVELGRGLHRRAHKQYSLSRYRRSQAMAILENGAYFRFAFVRNPWDRLVSAYYSKFVFAREKPAFALPVIDEIYRHSGQTPDHERSISYRDFVNHVSRSPDEVLDEHWKPQCLFLGATKFDFIGRLEHLRSDFETLRDQLGLPELSVGKSNATPYSATALDTDVALPDLPAPELAARGIYPDYQALYTPDLVELVRQRYRQDVERFGYQFD